MIERSVLLDPAESVFGSHMDLIQAGTQFHSPRL